MFPARQSRDSAKWSDSRLHAPTHSPPWSGAGSVRSVSTRINAVFDCGGTHFLLSFVPKHLKYQFDSERQVGLRLFPRLTLAVRARHFGAMCPIPPVATIFDDCGVLILHATSVPDPSGLLRPRRSFVGTGLPSVHECSKSGGRVVSRRCVRSRHDDQKPRIPAQHCVDVRPRTAFREGGFCPRHTEIDRTPSRVDGEPQHDARSPRPPPRRLIARGPRRRARLRL